MANQRKIDYLVGAIVGFITGLIVLIPLKNIEVGGAVVIFVLPFALSVLWIFGLWFGRFLTRWLSFTYQFAKFVIVGFLNTAIDFGVLNALSILTGLTSGLLIGGVNVPGFTLAAINSYFWNKFWVFRRPAEALAKAGNNKTDYSDFFTFALVVIIGIFINGGIVVLITTYILPLAGLSAERWLNIAKVVASAVSLIWNFIGFKFLVFKK